MDQKINLLNNFESSVYENRRIISFYTLSQEAGLYNKLVHALTTKRYL